MFLDEFIDIWVVKKNCQIGKEKKTSESNLNEIWISNGCFWIAEEPQYLFINYINGRTIGCNRMCSNVYFCQIFNSVASRVLIYSNTALRALALLSSWRFVNVKLRDFSLYKNIPFGLGWLKRDFCFRIIIHNLITLNIFRFPFFCSQSMLLSRDSYE